MTNYKQVNEQLDLFIKNEQIPNIIFYGKEGSGKKKIVYDFIHKIYNNNTNHIKNYVMYVNCGFGKGIKFIREELKFFAKTNIHNCGKLIKIIILINADKLTIDAQSALRRCIELFSYSTRFFMIIKNKHTLLKPILSRFCDIYIDGPTTHIPSINKSQKSKIQYLKNKLILLDKTDLSKISEFVDTIYLKGYSYLDLFEIIKTVKIDPFTKYTLLYNLEKYKKEYRNEKTFMLTILVFLYFRSNISLENINSI